MKIKCKLCNTIIEGDKKRDYDILQMWKMCNR